MLFVFFSPQDIFSINKAETYQFNSSIVPTIISPLSHCSSPTKISNSSHPEFNAGLYLAFFYYVSMMKIFKYNEFIHGYKPHFTGVHVVRALVVTLKQQIQVANTPE